METTQERVERGLAQLGKDIVGLFNGKPKGSSEIIVESKGVPVVQNIINNYSGETQTPTQIRKFGFIDVFKIAFCIIVIVIVAKIVFDTSGFVDGFDSIVRFFHSF